MRTKKAILLFYIVFITQSFLINIALSQEAEVTFVDIEDGDLHYAEKIQLACDLLGVGLETHFIGTTNDSEILKSSIVLHDKEVLILTGRVLKYFNEKIDTHFGHRDRKTKILILGINSDVDMANLRIWSENRIMNFRHFDLPSLPASIKVVKNDLISMELGGLEYPLSGSGLGMINGFELVDSFGAVSLVDVVDESGKPVCPVFLKTDSAERSVFFLSSWEKIFSAETNSIYKIMPMLMFLKYSLGDRCWHGTNDYANLTIDDPWLREPYGFISFTNLCREAKKASFHVTIGFIPFNYKKSQIGAVEVFRKCKENLSIAIHGNNHDFSEFRSSKNERLADKKNSDIYPDEKSILQALYRMNTFSRKTDLSYDRVMIFPRGMFTKESLGLLKKHNFLITVNGTIPFNAEEIANQVDRMRGITFEFEKFPMLIRSGISDWKNDKRALAIEKSWIQIRLFLDLPILFYTHHSFFKDGADEFNSIANTVNRIQPEVVWTGLGNIGNRLYLQKKSNDREIEILAFSSDLIIKNKYNVPMKFVVRKQEDFMIPIQTVVVDGVEHEYVKDGNYIRAEVLIEPGCEKNIRILYYSDSQVGSFTYSDSDLQATLIRTLSDFRDNYLSKVPFGDNLVKIIYWMGGVKAVVIGFLGLTGIILILLAWYIKNKNSKKRILAE